MINDSKLPSLSNWIKIYFTQKNYITFMNYVYRGLPLDNETTLMMQNFMLFGSINDVLVDTKMYIPEVISEFGKHKVFPKYQEFAIWSTDISDVMKYLNTNVDPITLKHASQLIRIHEGKAISPIKVSEYAKEMFNPMIVNHILAYTKGIAVNAVIAPKGIV